MQTSGNDAAPQAENSTPGIPTFYAHARQVIIAADVWEKALKKGEHPWIGDEPLDPTLKGVLKQLPPVARGLTAKDFHVFDDGAEQSINYFKEADFPAVNMTNQWYFFPTVVGTWGGFQPYHNVDAPYATYLIGYVPPAIQPGGCRNVKVIVKGRTTETNRSEYCYSPQNNIDMIAGTKLGEKMRNFASSPSNGSFKVSVQTFTFWSSGVLGLATEGQAVTTPGNDFTYVVEVHDSKAPAVVQISLGFDPPEKTWYFPCQKGDAVYVLGIVKKTNGQPAGQFADTFSCPGTLTFYPGMHKVASGVFVPSRFDTQLDLAPGDYNLSVVVSDGRYFGRTETPLQVRPLDSQHLMISDLVVGGVLRNAAWVLREAASVSPSSVVPAPLVSKNIQFFPDSAPPTRLPKHTPLFLYFEIYKPARDQASTVYYRYKITDLKTGSPVMNRGPMSASDWLVPGNAVVPIGLKVATDDLKTGTYRLELQASDSAGRETEWRQADFTIK